VSLLEFEGRLRYPSGFQIDAAFTTPAGITALFGPSGSGKTSILSMIAGLRRPDTGCIRLAGRTLFDRAKRINVRPEARQIGYVFQDSLLFPHLSVRRNLLYGWRRRAPRRVTVKVELERVVTVLELADLLERMPHTLSGGQRQRVALGRALLSGPQLLLCDEPLAALDDTLKQRVLEYVEHVLQEWHVPTVYVTHNADEVRRLATYVVRLQDGRVQAVGPPKDVL
jgi:molybdate transport system ATP-binding protein